MEKKTAKNFNIVISGVGGQGILTLQKIIAQAAFAEGFELKTSELHGLSQRGGSVETHIRFGEKVFSPLVKEGGADLVISLEIQEVLRACYYSSKEAKTVFLVNNFSAPIPNAVSPQAESVLEKLKRFSSKIFMISASEISRKETGSDVAGGIYLLGFAVKEDLIPLKTDSLFSAMKKIIPEKHWEMNEKIFNLARYQ